MFTSVKLTNRLDEQMSSTTNGLINPIRFTKPNATWTTTSLDKRTFGVIPAVIPFNDQKVSFTDLENEKRVSLPARCHSVGPEVEPESQL